MVLGVEFREFRGLGIGFRDKGSGLEVSKKGSGFPERRMRIPECGCFCTNPKP